MSSALNPAGPAIHQNLADRLKAAKVPVQAGQQDPPAGVVLFFTVLRDIHSLIVWLDSKLVHCGAFWATAGSWTVCEISYTAFSIHQGHALY